MTDLAKLVVKLEAQTADYQKNLEKAQKQLDRFNKSSSASAASIGKGIAAAATVAAGALVYMGKAAIDNADRLNLLSQSTGVSTEALSQLEYAAQMSGLSSEDLTKGLTKLSKAAFAAASEGGSAAEKFERLGIQVKNADGSIRPTEDLLLDIADKFSKMEDGAAKTGMAMEIFGKSGAQLIPFLNEGKAGIAALTAEADRLGLTLGGDAAKAADAFNDNLDRLKFAAQGVVNQAVQQMLPMLVAMSERFVASAKSGGVLSMGVTALVGVFKTLVSAGVIVTSIFQQLGRVIYGVGSAVLAVASGEFKLAKQEIMDAFSEARANVTDDMETIAAVWSNKVPEIAGATQKLDEEVKDTIVFNPTKAGKLAEDAAAKAVEGFKKMADGLREQVDTFGMGEVAVLKYQLAHGELAKELATGGPAAQAYADEVVVLTEKLLDLEAASERTKASQEAWQSLVDKGADITASVATPVETYMARIAELNDALQLGVITQETYNRAIGTAQKAFDDASKVGTDFMEQASRNVQDILATYLEDPFSKSLDDLVADFGQMIIKMAAQAAAADIAGRLFGTGGVGSGGGWLGQLGNFAMGAISSWAGGPSSGLSEIAVTAQRLPVAGGRAFGGPVSAGKAYIVGEQGKAERFVPAVNGRIEQMSGRGGMNVNQNFSIQTNGSPISRSTEQQIAAAAARGLAQANRRNN
jgi:hypothetical protein